jgi:hypothetical protein
MYQYKHMIILITVPLANCKECKELHTDALKILTSFRALRFSSTEPSWLQRYSAELQSLKRNLLRVVSTMCASSDLVARPVLLVTGHVVLSHGG